MPAAAPAAPPSIPDDPTWVAGNGSAQAVVSDGDRAWVAGDFTVAAARTGPGTAVDLTGQRLPGYAELTDASSAPLNVDAAIADGAGGWYAAGDFNSAGGVARPGLVHLLADGSVDSAFNAQATAG